MNQFETATNVDRFWELTNLVSKQKFFLNPIQYETVSKPINRHFQPSLVAFKNRRKIFILVNVLTTTNSICKSLVIIEKNIYHPDTAASVDSDDFSRTIHFKTITYDIVYKGTPQYGITKEPRTF